MSTHQAAPTIVFLPGMMCNQALYQPQIDHFAPRHPVVVADLSQDASMAAMAKRVLDTAPAEFCLVGLSMGGIVAFEVMRQAPERVQALALLDTNDLAELPERQALRQAQLDRTHADTWLNIVVEEMMPHYLAQQSSGNQALLDTIKGMAEEQGLQAFLNQSKALKYRPDSHQSLADIHCPTLVLCGEEDALCPISHHERIAAGIDNAELVIVKNAGHLSTLEQPEHVNHALERLFQQI